MPRTLIVLFRRDPSRDREESHVRLEGYEFLWPEGRPLAVGFDAFCKHGQRLLGLSRHLADCQERLLQVMCFPVRSREEDMTRVPGARVRRFFIERQGRQGRLHFFDGTPTTIVFDLDRDEARVLRWVGLPSLRDGQRQWFDLAACPADATVAAPTPAVGAFGNHTLPRGSVG